ncbi:MAG: type II toxin-antitoxin system Phd/YefM family antitoxin [Propionibacteriaceae bacterium]|jgi:prevent-host-death family protein|nr:type II toxin-antitoxin system Phd/YefM family antitoxin [Propionibacteriaceae bacterium]
MTVMTSREFNQRTHAAKLAAQYGPVIITDRGKPSHVLLTYSDYQTGDSRIASLAETFAGIPEAGLIDLPLTISSESSQPAKFD